MGKIQLTQVRKSFGDVHVIPGIDLTIEDGEFVVFVGPSGCGKSTLLRLIAGLEDISAGRIEIDGAEATHLPPAKRGLAMVFQSYALYPHMTMRKNISWSKALWWVAKGRALAPPGMGCSMGVSTSKKLCCTMNSRMQLTALLRAMKRWREVSSVMRST